MHELVTLTYINFYVFAILLVCGIVGLYIGTSTNDSKMIIAGVIFLFIAVVYAVSFFSPVKPSNQQKISFQNSCENSTVSHTEPVTEPTSSTELYNLKPIKDFPNLYYDSYSHIVFKKVYKDSSLSKATKYKYFPLMSKDNKFYYYDPNSNEIKLEKKDIDNDN